MKRDGLKQNRDDIFATRPCELSNRFKHLWRVGTGRDGLQRYLLLRARDKGNVFTRPFPSLPSLSGDVA